MGAGEIQPAFVKADLILRMQVIGLLTGLTELTGFLTATGRRIQIFVWRTFNN